MPRPLAAALALAGLLLAGPDAAAQGDLRRIQASFHPGPKFFLPKPPNVRASSVGPSDAGAAEPWSVEENLVVAGLAAVAATAPVWGPHEAWDPGFDQPGWFPAYPGALPDRGYLTTGFPTEWAESDPWDEHHVKPWAVRVGAEAGDDFDGLRRLGGQLFLDTDWCRLGLLANWNWYAERLPAGLGTDRALVSDYNLTWRVTQADWVLMHVGAGVRAWSAHGHTDLGPNVLYRADVFTLEHLHLSGLFEIGTVRSALVLHGQVQAGWVFRHGEVFVGYDLLRVKKVPLHSPTVGVRLWF